MCNTRRDSNHKCRPLFSGRRVRTGEGSGGAQRAVGSKTSGDSHVAARHQSIVSARQPRARRRRIRRNRAVLGHLSAATRHGPCRQTIERAAAATKTADTGASIAKRPQTRRAKGGFRVGAHGDVVSMGPARQRYPGCADIKITTDDHAASLSGTLPTSTPGTLRSGPVADGKAHAQARLSLSQDSRCGDALLLSSHATSFASCIPTFINKRHYVKALARALRRDRRRHPETSQAKARSTRFIRERVHLDG